MRRGGALNEELTERSLSDSLRRWGIRFHWGIRVRPFLSYSHCARDTRDLLLWLDI